MDIEMRILVVDDKPEVLDFIANHLKEQGYLIETACNGLDALSKSKGDHFDLFIIDHLMPIMNGIQLSKNLAQNEKTVNTPILFMTTQGRESVESLEEHKLFSAVIEKPVEQSSLFSLVKTFSSQNSLRQSL
jgi:CheY-like chemotaxis protein